ncbi:unnamed protein product [Caretta caretta]
MELWGGQLQIIIWCWRLSETGDWRRWTLSLIQTSNSYVPVLKGEASVSTDENGIAHRASYILKVELVN